MLLFLLQLIAVPPVTLVFGAIVFGMSRPEDGDMRNLIAYLAFCIVGFVLGYAFQFQVPRAFGHGGWLAWLLPVSFLAYSLISDARNQATRIDLHGSLFWPGPNDYGFGLPLFVLPAIASCFYSLGVVAAKVIQRAKPGRSSPPDKAAD